MRRWVRATTWFGAMSLFGATFVSHLEQTAQLPAWLMSDGIRHWTSSRTVFGLPVEFPLALWFLSVAVHRGAVKFQSVDLLYFWSGTVVSALCAGLLYQVGVRCLPITFASVAALVVVIDSGFRLHRLPSAAATSVGDDIRHDWALLTRPQSLVKLVAAGAAVVLAAQYLVLTRTATTQADRDAELARWYEAEPRIASPELVTPGKIRVVAFGDYLCPACSFQIPALEKTVNRYHTGGYEEVELVLRDFPLNSDCNPSVSTRIHPLACRAAVAARVADRFLERSESQAFRARLYARHGRLTEADILRELEARRLLEQFYETYDEELKAVRDAARLGGTLGVSGTPTVFVDGRLLRSAEPRVVGAILSYLSRKLGARSSTSPAELELGCPYTVPDARV